MREIHEQLTVHYCYGTDKRRTQKEIVFSKHFLHIITELQNKPEHTKRCALCEELKTKI